MSPLYFFILKLIDSDHYTVYGNRPMSDYQYDKSVKDNKIFKEGTVWEFVTKYEAGK